MLGYWRLHAQFQAWLEGKLLSLLPEHEKLLLFHENILEKIYILDLDGLLPVVWKRYAQTGRPSRNQPEIFRALVLMSHFKEGISSFVKRLKAHPVLAIICGFEPDSVPGVGTFYDFLDRFWLEDEPAKVIREPFTKRSKRPKGSDKLADTDSNRVSGLVQKVLAGQPPRDRPEKLLQKILTECAVKPSLELKLCGDSRKLTIAGDGAPLNTGANPRGKKICSCKEQGLYHCTCPRQYTGPTANWGWDSYHEQWFYGHTLYCITAADSYNDLPLLIHVTQASRHDSGTFVTAYVHLREIYGELPIATALLDSAHDAYDIYRMLLAHGIEPFIDLNKRKSGIRTCSEVKVSGDGRPLCMAGLEMQHCGAALKRQRIKWRCPLHKELDSCPHSQSCSPSPYGRVFYTKMKDDFRLFTKTPRGSKAWKKIYGRRTSVERTLKRTLVDYRIESLRFRAESRWVWFASLSAINQHLDAQVSALGMTLFHKLDLNRKAA